MGNKTIAFGDVADLVRRTVQPQEVAGMPYIGLEHIEAGSLCLNGYGQAEDVTSTKFRFSQGDILFGKLRPYFRKVIRAPFDGVCSTDIWTVRAKEGIDQGYLFYWMAAQDFVDFATAGSEGTKMPRAKWEHVSRYERVRLPFNEQRAIAHILGTLDDKIELNRKMNETLEAMARAIFKSWFVDFDPVRAKAEGRDPGLPKEIAALFPDSFEDSELGEIPKGWRVGKVEDLGLIVCGKTPPTKDPENYSDKMPFITIPDMHGKVFVIETGKYLSSKGIQTQENKTIPANSICVSCIATPGLVIITSEPVQTNQQINSVVPIDKSTSFYCYYVLRGLSDNIKAAGSGGSVTLNLNKGKFSALPVLQPPALAMTIYQKKVQPLFERILSNEKQTRTIVAIRDTLLPKLISGEIRVKDAEKTIEVTS